ncbi:MAG: AAA+ ATPase superfamily predicted ATPase [Verrucomicrobiales bacterium]
MKDQEPLIGRRNEVRLLDEIIADPVPALVAIYGRRRVGKTFLVRRATANALKFELTGLKDANLREQLENFSSALAAASSGKVTGVPKSWKEAFALLAKWFEMLPRRERHVLFMDELPWLATPRSRFLQALDHFWNSWASRQSNLVLIVCGSAASWMIRKLLHDRGGLHNRVTHRLRLDPFTLAETREFLSKRRVPLGELQIAELYMAMGGIPHYLKQVRRGESTAQAIDRICFAKDGLLRNEFDLLYPALFDSPERHLEVVRALAKKSLTHQEIAATSGLSDGGRLSTIIKELEESGFVRATLPFGKKKKDTRYRLSDEYSRFYLRWIESWRGDTGGWLKMRGRPAWRAWSGMAFEELCMKHLGQIKAALGIAGVSTESSSWTFRPKEVTETGTQIDLLIDRADGCINLCEMKFCEGPFVIDKRYATLLRQRRETFRRETGTKKSLFLTFVTTADVKHNPYGLELVDASVTLDTLFAPTQ